MDGRYHTKAITVASKKGVLKIFPNFTGKNLCRSLFSNKVAGQRPATLSKMRL